MIVVIHTDSRCALTTPSKTRMPSLTQISLVNSISNLNCAFLCICKRQDDIRLINHLSTRFGVLNLHMARMTLAHAQTNCEVSQFGR